MLFWHLHRSFLLLYSIKYTIVLWCTGEISIIDIFFIYILIFNHPLAMQLRGCQAFVRNIWAYCFIYNAYHILSVRTMSLATFDCRTMYNWLEPGLFINGTRSFCYRTVPTASAPTMCVSACALCPVVNACELYLYVCRCHSLPGYDRWLRTLLALFVQS